MKTAYFSLLSSLLSSEVSDDHCSHETLGTVKADGAASRSRTLSPLPLYISGWQERLQQQALYTTEVRRPYRVRRA